MINHRIECGRAQGNENAQMIGFLGDVDSRKCARSESAMHRWQKRSGGPLCRLVKSPTTRPPAVELSTQAHAVVPISNVVTNVTKAIRAIVTIRRGAAVLSIDNDLNR
jgi:hypothetical protein